MAVRHGTVTASESRSAVERKPVVTRMASLCRSGAMYCENTDFGDLALLLDPGARRCTAARISIRRLGMHIDLMDTMGLVRSCFAVLRAQTVRLRSIIHGSAFQHDRDAEAPQASQKTRRLEFFSEFQSFPPNERCCGSGTDDLRVCGLRHVTIALLRRSHFHLHCT